jgi:DNA-binding NarL/FixJ family response regulator
VTDLTTVLVADDDADYRLLVRLGLDGAPGFASILEASGIEEAVELAHRHAPDVLLLDESLPGAFEAVWRLPAGDRAPKLVLVSSRPPHELADVAAAAGAVGYLGKDLAPSELPAAIADVTRLVHRLETVLSKAMHDLPADVRSAGAARRMVRRALEGWCDDDLIDDIALCVSELVTNAVVHASSAPRVLVHVRPTVIHIEISDDSEALPVLRGAGPQDTSGRGMAILGTLSERWGSYRRSGGGKTVWFDVTRATGELVGSAR